MWVNTCERREDKPIKREEQTRARTLHKDAASQRKSAMQVDVWTKIIQKRGAPMYCKKESGDLLFAITVEGGPRK
jgi:hypothetical protein